MGAQPLFGRGAHGFAQHFAFPLLLGRNGLYVGGLGFFGELHLASGAGDFGGLVLGAGGDVVVEAADETENIGGLVGEEGVERGGVEVPEGLLHQGEEGRIRAGRRGRRRFLF